MTDRQVQVHGPERIGSFVINGSSDDYGVFGAIERGSGHYEAHVMSMLAALTQSGDVCLDVGANIGVITVALARLCPQGHVYAFEPGDSSFGFLQRNVADNGLTNVSVDQIGLYDVTGVLSLQVDEGHPGGAYLASTDAHEATSESVAVTRLDDWVKDRNIDRIDVMKIDIEGAELHALDGAADAIERLRPTLVVECNPVALRRFQNVESDALVEALRTWYDRIYFVEGAGLREIESAEHARAELRRQGIIDLVCGPRADAIAARPVTSRTGATDRAKDVARKVVRKARGARGTIASRRSGSSYSPPLNFVTDPAYVARFAVNRLVALRGTTMTLPLALHNTSGSWYSSTFDGHPVSASYHWLDANGATIERDGIRTFLPKPIGPGAEAVIDLMVAMPDEPGEYTLVFALVQEVFAWFDDLDPALGIELPVVIR